MTGFNFFRCNVIRKHLIRLHAIEVVVIRFPVAYYGRRIKLKQKPKGMITRYKKNKSTKLSAADQVCEKMLESKLGFPDVLKNLDKSFVFLFFPKDGSTVETNSP